MLNNPWLIGILVTFVIGAGCILAIVFSLKWMRRVVSVSGYLSAAAVGMTIMAFASFSMLKQGVSSELPKDSNKVLMYKHVYWLKEESPDFALSRAKALWESVPSTDSKFLLGLAYARANQLDKGIPILEEARSTIRLAAYVKESELDAVLGDLSAVENDVIQPSTVERAVAKGVSAFQARLEHEVADEVKQDLVALARLDPHRLEFVLKGKPAGQGTELSTAQRLYQDAVKRQPEDPVMKQELARTAIYMGDSLTAQKLLIDVLQQYPTAEEPAVLLGDLLLNQEKAQLPEESWSSLPHYAESKRRAQQEQKKRLQEWSEEVRPGDEEAARTVRDRLQTIRNNTELAPHLAYSIVKPHEKDGQPEALFLMARYFYQQHDEEASSSYIRKLANEPDKLTVPQQYYVQSLVSMSTDAGQLTSEQLLQRNEWTTSAYQSFRALEGRRLREAALTDQERSFAVHLSNELIRLSKESIRISSIQANENGAVELYVTADNIRELNKANLRLMDNELAVQDFTVEKIGEASSYRRNIMMVMDRSGSMEGDRISTAKLAVKSFISRLKANERVGVITFSSDNSVLHPLTTDNQSVSRAVSGVAAGGGTSIAPAFDAGIKQLGMESGERVLFMLSDGEDNQFSQPATRAAIIQKANEGGITIFSIGFGAGYETLREVSELTGGRYIPAAGLDDLINSFAEISRTLEQSYKISYKLNPMAKGVHRVSLQGPSNTRASKTYTIPSSEKGEAGRSAAYEQAGQYIDFAIHKTIPNRITASKLGTTDVEITGIGFHQVQKVLLDGKELSFDPVSDSRINMTVRNNLSIGVHNIALVAKDQREAKYRLSVTKSGDQESRTFGYATIYGDFIENKGNTEIRFLGNTSVDRFLYDSAGEMVLKDNRVLSFDGLLLDVDHTKIGIIPSVLMDVRNAAQRYVPYSVTMERDDLGKQFSVKRQIAGVTIDGTSLSKFGLEVSLGSVFQYTAHYEPDKGILQAKQAGFKGFSAIGELNQRKLKDMAKVVKFLPSDLSLIFEYEPDNITVAGEVAATIDTGAVEATNLKLGVKYGARNNRLELSGEANELSLFGKKIEIPLSRRNDGISKIGGTLIFENGGLAGIGAKLEAGVGLPLGTTGLNVKGVSFLADWGSSREGKIGLVIGTVADGPFLRVIEWVDYIPGIDFPEKATVCVLCLEGEAGVRGIATEDWSFNGQLAAKFFGFEAAKGTAYFDSHEITLGVSVDSLIMQLNGQTSVVWADPDYAGDTTLKYFGTLEALMQKGKLALVVVPQHFDRSYLNLKFDTWLFDPQIHIGSKIKVYR
ncbi:VWA domain-containing protein [Paenibacillus koleovorans]|uniref:VWA domain-containing protein n=1 Tax=Paenibacillus koleovorans TaxID=121608 RepID=UPI000FDC8347|nr:VWA domain-containing protein [Paenibacillus koleovorans]